MFKYIHVKLIFWVNPNSTYAFWRHFWKHWYALLKKLDAWHLLSIFGQYLTIVVQHLSNICQYLLIYGTAYVLANICPYWLFPSGLGMGRLSEGLLYIHVKVMYGWYISCIHDCVFIVSFSLKKNPIKKHRLPPPHKNSHQTSNP